MDFGAQLRAQLRRAPWYALSIAFHVVLVLILFNMDWSRSTTKTHRVIQSSALPEAVEIVDPPPPPPEVVPEEIEQELEDPVVNEEDVQPLLEDERPLAAANDLLDAVNREALIGTGGGWGGGASGGGGGRAAKKSGTATQKSVDAGLHWLSLHQAHAGYWDCDDFSGECTGNRCDGAGNPLNDVGVTGLALLAFLGAGHTSSDGRYQNVVKDGLEWLRLEQDREDGCFGTKAGHHFLYGHAIATLAMVEGYHLSKQPRLKSVAQRGLDFISRARNPYKAWRYGYPPDSDNDVSITGWMLFALFAGKDAGLAIDANAITDGMAFLEEMTDPGTGRTGYRDRGSLPAREDEDRAKWPAERTESMTAVAALCRVFHQEDPAKSPRLRQAADLLGHQLPRWNEDAGTIDFYYWYYGSYAMWQIGGSSWNQWQRAMLDSIVAHQRTGGHEDGSWDPQVDPWGDDGGRVYSTAINVLCLEVYYRYDKVFGAR